MTNTPAPYVLVPRDVAAELIRRLDTMQIPHVLVQQITILGYMANLLRDALAAPPAPAAQEPPGLRAELEKLAETLECIDETKLRAILARYYGSETK